MEWNPLKGAWEPVVSPSANQARRSMIYIILMIFPSQVDEELVKAQQAAYKVEGVDENVR